MMAFSDDSEVEGEGDFEGPVLGTTATRPRSNTAFPGSPFSPAPSSDIFTNAFKRRTTFTVSINSKFQKPFIFNFLDTRNRLASRHPPHPP